MVAAIAVAIPVIMHLSEEYFYPFKSPYKETENMKELEEKIRNLQSRLDDLKDKLKSEEEELRHKEIKVLATAEQEKGFEKSRAAIKSIKSDVESLDKETEKYTQQLKKLKEPLLAQDKKAYHDHRLKLFVGKMVMALILILLALFLRHVLLQTALMGGALFITVMAYVMGWDDLSTGLLLLTMVAWLTLLILLVIRFYEKSLPKSGSVHT